MLDKVLIASVDGSKDGVDAVREGRSVNTSAQFPVQVAEACAANAYKILKGETIEPKSVKIPSVLIDGGNCNKLPGY